MSNNNNTNNNNFSKYKINKRNQNVNNSQKVSCIACNPKGEKPNIIVGFDNGMIKLFNFTETGNLVCDNNLLNYHRNIVTCILFNPINSLIFVSCSIDNSLILWNLMNNDISCEIKTNAISNDRSSKLIFNYDGSIICVRYDNYIKLYKIIFQSSNENNHINISLNRGIRYNTETYGDNHNYSFFFHPSKNVLFVGFDNPDYIYIFYINEQNQLTILSRFILTTYIFSSCVNIIGNTLFLVDTDNRYLSMFSISEGYKKLEKMNRYNLTEYFDQYPDIIPLSHPKNSEILLLYDFFNIIILQIISSRIKCLYKYKHPTKITSCSFNFLGNAIIFSSENKLVILELKYNIRNNNSLNRGLKILGNMPISVSST